MRPDRLPHALEIQADLALALGEAAVKMARAAAAGVARRRRARHGETLRPGADTPMWNALAAAVAAELHRRGERARLARVLQWPRQRVTDLLRGRTRMPDAERTLLLLAWLHARRQGRDLA